MVLEEGRIIEFDKYATLMCHHIEWLTFYSPSSLLINTSSKFHALCKASGKDEFVMLKKMAGL